MAQRAPVYVQPMAPVEETVEPTRSDKEHRPSVYTDGVIMLVYTLSDENHFVAARGTPAFTGLTRERWLSVPRFFAGILWVVLYAAPLAPSQRRPAYGYQVDRALTADTQR